MIVAELEGSLYNPIRLTNVVATRWQPVRIRVAMPAQEHRKLCDQERAELALSEALTARGLTPTMVEWLGLCAYVRRKHCTERAIAEAVEPANWPRLLQFCRKQLERAVCA